MSLKRTTLHVLSKIKVHLLEYSEAYILLPFALFVMWAAPYVYYFNTGRWPENDPGDLVGWAIRFSGIALVLTLAGLAKSRLIGYVAKKEWNSPLLNFLAMVVDVVSLLVLIYMIGKMMQQPIS